jgi:SAM-dependent methyltransferase
MDAGYARRYSQLYAQHWWWRAREAFIVAQLRRLRPPSGWARILDVGCGDGLFFPRLRELGAVVEGVEPDPATLTHAPPGRGDIHVQPFETFAPASRYALILMLDVVEHVPDAEAFLRHALELLEPGGTLLVTVPAFALLWTNHDVVNHHVRRYTKRTFAALAARVGMRVDRSRYFFHGLFFAKLAVRAVERVRRPAPAPAAVPPRWINRGAYLACRLEQRLCDRMPPPFGSSLLVAGGRAAAA